MLWSSLSALFASFLSFQAGLIPDHKKSSIAGIACWFTHLKLIFPRFVLRRALGLCLLANKPPVFLIAFNFFLGVFHTALCNRYFWGFAVKPETYLKLDCSMNFWILCFWGHLLSFCLCWTSECPLAFPAESAWSCQYFSGRLDDYLSEYSDWIYGEIA